MKAVEYKAMIVIMEYKGFVSILYGINGHPVMMTLVTRLQNVSYKVLIIS
jgi:hypothetical protein